MNDLDEIAPLVDEAWYSTKGQRRKTVVASLLAAVLLLVSWLLLLVAYTNATAGPVDETDAERVERIIESSVGRLEWLSLVVGIGMWPVAVVIASRLVGLRGIGPGIVAAIGCLVLLALLVFWFMMISGT